MLKVDKKITEISYDDMINTMVNDIKEMDCYELKSLFEDMYPVLVEDVEGNEGKQVVVKLDETNVIPGFTLKDIF